MKVSYAERQAALIVKLVRLVVTEFTENTRIIDGLPGVCSDLCGEFVGKTLVVDRKSINMACFRAISLSLSLSMCHRMCRAVFGICRF